MSEAVFEERFIKLVEDNGGFEYYQAYRGAVDLILGGKGSTFWYTVMKKGKVTESYIGKYVGGVWEDVYVKGIGATQKTKGMSAGSSIRKIAEKAYLLFCPTRAKTRENGAFYGSRPAEKCRKINGFQRFR